MHYRKISDFNVSIGGTKSDFDASIRQNLVTSMHPLPEPTVPSMRSLPPLLYCEFLYYRRYHIIGKRKQCAIIREFAPPPPLHVFQGGVRFRRTRNACIDEQHIDHSSHRTYMHATTRGSEYTKKNGLSVPKNGRKSNFTIVMLNNYIGKNIYSLLYTSKYGSINTANEKAIFLFVCNRKIYRHKNKNKNKIKDRR